MANTYKNIVITPNRDTDAANVPSIRFSGGDGTSNTDINVRVYTTQSGTLSFEGSAGQLFSITNDLTNTIFSVNDVSGIPSIDVNANGDIFLAPFGGSVNIRGKLIQNAIINNSTTLISTGYTVATFNAGSNISAYGTWQPNAANGNYQVATANGSVTITTPPANCAIDILFINASNRNPGAVFFTGYNVSATPGSTYAVTSNQRYILSIREINNIATYSWYALQ